MVPPEDPEPPSLLAEDFEQAVTDNTKAHAAAPMTTLRRFIDTPLLHLNSVRVVIW
jgi:hypothetical protein